MPFDSDTIETALFSAVFAGFVAVSSTRLIEKCGDLGAIMTSMPTTVVPALIGVAVAATAANSTGRLRDACFAVPPGMLVDAGFLLQWRFWPSRLPAAMPSNQKLVATIVLSLSFWFIASLFIITLTERMSDATKVLFGLFCLCLLLLVGFTTVFGFGQTSAFSYSEHFTIKSGSSCGEDLNELDENNNNENDDDDQQQQQRIDEEEAELQAQLQKQQLEEEERARLREQFQQELKERLRKRREELQPPVTMKVLAARASLAACSNFVTVLLSSISGSMAGLFSVFPAVFMTVCVSVWLSRGPEFLASSAIGPVVLGSVAVPLFSIAFYVVFEFFTKQNILVAAVVAWFFAVLAGSVPASRLLVRVGAQKKKG